MRFANRGTVTLDDAANLSIPVRAKPSTTERKARHHKSLASIQQGNNLETVWTHVAHAALAKQIIDGFQCGRTGNGPGKTLKVELHVCMRGETIGSKGDVPCGSPELTLLFPWY